MWHMKCLPLIIDIADHRNAYVHADSIHATYSDIKFHSSLFLMIARGAMIKILKKFSIVTSSFTEIEVVSSGERFSKCT